MPITADLGVVFMVLSDEGLQRWNEAITQEKEFVPIRKFMHVHHLLTADQKTRLDAIMEKRYKGLS